MVVVDPFAGTVCDGFGFKRLTFVLMVRGANGLVGLGLVPKILVPGTALLGFNRKLFVGVTT
jgi:hypothetical protein